MIKPVTKGQCVECGLLDQYVYACDYCGSDVCSFCNADVAPLVLCRQCHPSKHREHWLHPKYALIDARRFLRDCSDVWRGVAEIVGPFSYRVNALESIFHTNHSRFSVEYMADVEIKPTNHSRVVARFLLPFPRSIQINTTLSEAALIQPATPTITVFGYSGADDKRCYTQPLRKRGAISANTLHNTIMQLATMPEELIPADFERTMAQL